MRREKQIRLYNILLPLWILVFWPSYLWLILIPANYIIDRTVLRWSLGDMPEKGVFCRKHTWKICIAGFFADFVGAAFLFGLMMLEAWVLDRDTIYREIFDVLWYGIGFNPFSNIFSLLIVAAAVFLAGVVIYFLDRFILKKAGLSAEQAKKSALRLAVITAPYLYFFPTEFLYNTDLLGY